MRWYARKTASRPPAYLQERISDLSHVTRVSMTAPGEAKKLLASVIEKIKAQGDHEYVEPLEQAVRRGLDSPSELRNLVEAVMITMKKDAEE